MSSPGQTIAKFQHNISQHCKPSICKLRPNDRNNWRQQKKTKNNLTQHIATLLVATRCVRLATLLRRVATCWELKIELVRKPGRNIVARAWPNDCNIMQHQQMLHEKFDHFQIWANNTQHVATCHDWSQQGGQKGATYCSQQYCDILRR